jgi:hypothetical protein
MHRVGAWPDCIESHQHDTISRVGYGFVNIRQKLRSVHDIPRNDDD